ncbi:MAG: hypothetical protein ACRDT2_14450 [Natronosporangium sp.]
MMSFTNGAGLKAVTFSPSTTLGELEHRCAAVTAGGDHRGLLLAEQHDVGFLHAERFAHLTHHSDPVAGVATGPVHEVPDEGEEAVAHAPGVHTVPVEVVAARNIGDPADAGRHTRLRPVRSWRR